MYANRFRRTTTRSGRPCLRQYMYIYHSEQVRKIRYVYEIVGRDFHQIDVFLQPRHDVMELLFGVRFRLAFVGRPFDHRLELTDLRHFERPAHNLLDQRLGQREKIAVVQYLRHRRDRENKSCRNEHRASRKWRIRRGHGEAVRDECQ